MLRVGLTGGIGSGKTTVADLFAAAGATVVDADLVAHELTGPGGAAMDTIRSAFGDTVVTADGALDRAVMRALAFADATARTRLEAILHPLIRMRMDERMRAAHTDVVIAAVPLLVEAGDWRARVDRVLVIDVPQAVQIARVMARSGLAREQVLAIIAAQATRAARLAAADDVLFNDGSPAELAEHVRRLYAHYTGLAGQRGGAPQAL